MYKFNYPNFIKRFFHHENMNHCTHLVIDNSVFAKIIEFNAIENLKLKI